MNVSNKLSPTASYYVRRLVQSQKTRIAQAMPESNGSDPTLLEPETLLNRLTLSPTERQQRISTLEVLARAYQVLTKDGRHPQQAHEIEGQILQILGIASDAAPEPQSAEGSEPFDLSTLTVAKALEILQDCLKSGEQYLGPRIAREYFGMTYYPSLQEAGFALEEGYQVKVTRPATDTLDRDELEALKGWVQSYLNRCSSIIHGFEMLVSQNVLTQVSPSRHE